MHYRLDDLTVRSATKDDAHQTLELMIRSDISEFGEADSDLEDLTHDWEQMDLSRDAWLMFAPGETLVGYASVMEWTSGLRYEFYGHPDWEGDDLVSALLALCEERGQVLAGRGQCGGQCVVRLYTGEANARDRAVAERAGFEPALYHVQMQIEMSAPPPQPSWPEGVACRTTVPGQDDRAIHELIQTAFDRPGRERHPFEDWRSFMMRPDIFRPDLWFLAVASGEVIGACLCFEYPDLGWVRQLGVAEPWRRQGLGGALLRHAFGQFARRGYRKVGLTVASDNPDAFAFYTQVGMDPLRRYVEYQKVIGSQPRPRATETAVGISVT
jgi:GNAT superfamily N-acetyltransferase